MKEVLGIDYGAKRIGLATANTVIKLATPYGVWPNNEEFLRRLKNLCEQRNCATIVIGLPRGLEGQETPQTAKVREFATEVERKLRLPVALQDEAATTVVAHTHKKISKRGDVDSLAAALILQDYLNNL